MMATEVFRYTELHRYLRDAWSEKKRRNPSFTLRSWARVLGMKSHSPLQLALEGKRGIPSRYLPRVMASLELRGAEREYFQALALFSRAKSASERTLHLERMEALSPRALPGREELDELRFLSNPLDAVIAEMTQLPEFTDSAAWIAARLALPASRVQIRESLARLKSLRILTVGEDGLKKTSRHFTTPADFRSTAIQAFLLETMAFAAQRLSQVPVAEREYGAYALPVRVRDVPELKLHLRRAIADVIARFEVSDPVDAEACIHMLSLQFFPVTRRKGASP